MNRFSYTFLIRLLSPALLVWMGLRARRSGGHWGVMSDARFGRYGAHKPLRQAIWVHAVSLGETRAVQPFVQALLDQGKPVLLTHMTATGREEGARAFQQAIQAGQLQQQWLPYDFPGVVKRFFAHYQPKAGVLMEREVWPNLIAASRAAGTPMFLVSARFSDQSLRQALRLGQVMRQAYRSLHAVYAQTLQDAQRLEQAGAEAVRVSGNFKFDVALSPSQIRQGREFAEHLQRKVVVIASTRDGEEWPFIQAIYKQEKRRQARGESLADSVLFCIVPRHPQRFNQVADLIAETGLPYLRRSALAEKGRSLAVVARACQSTLILLGDSLGEMPRYYAASNVAIVGGSFEKFGGQNFIEACAVGIPVIVGPYTRNFQQAVTDAVAEGAALRVSSPEQAIDQAMGLLKDATTHSRMGEAGLHWVQKHKGAVARVLTALNKLQ